MWSEVEVVGESPRERYGHTLTFTKPYVILFGGNTATQTINDSWCLNTSRAPFTWAKLQIRSELPSPRVYHSAAHCQSGAATGMIVIFGGRNGMNQSLNDTWGLRKHRDGRWDWVKAPYHQGVSPKGRFQHSSLFLGTLMFIVGGKGNELNDTMQLDIYDTENSQWTSFNSLQRYRHIAWLFGGNIFLHGGFGPVNHALPISEVFRIDLVKSFAGQDALLQKLLIFIESYSPHPSRGPTPPISPRASNTPGQIGKDLEHERQTLPHVSSIHPPQGGKGPLEDKVFNIKIGKNEDMMMDDKKLHEEFLNKLLKPKDYINYPEGMRFIFSAQQIIALCDQAEELIKKQPMLLKIESPVMIFGDIHGQYSDLMRFFDMFGSPYDTYTGKDDKIQYFDYLFLGDYVDRGNHCLETVCLLLALKVKYPDQIHLIRGNHEDKMINDTFGLSEELSSRLEEDPGQPYSVFNRLNQLFEYLPLAALVDDKIFCLHGGIGANLQKVEQVQQLDVLRPLTVVHEVKTDTDRLIVDILWSDPTESDNELGILPNTVRDPDGTGNIVKFGPDIVKKFLKQNNLLKIIRAHECVNDGVERFAGGDLITVFSATNYCGKHKNAGAVLCLKKNFEFLPKLVYPTSLAQGNWIEDEDTMRNRPPTPPRWRENNG